MKKVRRIAVVFLLITIVTITGCSLTDRASAAEPKQVFCSVGTAEKYVANKLGLSVNGGGYGAYRDALVEAQVIKPKELTDTAKKLTKGELALLAAGVMEYRGEKTDKVRSDAIREKKRISDLDKIEKSYRDAMIFVFGEGVMVGSSNGKYSQSRTFKAGDLVTAGAMKSVIAKAFGEKERSVMSPDGQLTRKTNLPKNHKRFDYILESFPNSFYEMKFMNERAIYGYTPVYLEHYAYPKDLKKIDYNTGYEVLKFTDMYEKNGDMWIQKLEDNLKYRLSFDYRTVDKKWIKGLASTYHIDYDKKENPYQIADIEEYVKTAKKNKVVIKAEQISVEPSTMYMEGGQFYVRCYIKFKVNATNVYEQNTDKQQELIYSRENYIYLCGLKKNAIYDHIFDISVGGHAVGERGDGFSVRTDMLMDWSGSDKK